jgi:hypothetical protein
MLSLLGTRETLPSIRLHNVSLNGHSFSPSISSYYPNQRSHSEQQHTNGMHPLETNIHLRTSSLKYSKNMFKQQRTKERAVSKPHPTCQ